MGVLTDQMQFSNLKIINKLQNLKATFIKTGKFSMEKVPVYHIVDENEKKKAS